MGGACRENKNVCGVFFWRNLKGRGYLGDLGVDGRTDNIKIDCKEMGWKYAG
jgi:hypothetical protein